MKTIIVTAADEGFSELLIDLLDSLAQFGEPLASAIGVLDLGLSPATLAAIRPRVTHIVAPGWDLTVRPDIARERPHVKAATARPFLPAHFPGHDMYLWLDADTWVQNRFAIDWLWRAASAGPMALVPEVDRCYTHAASTVRWRTKRLQDFFLDEGAALLAHNTYFNSGVFALRAGAPHWQAWARHLQTGLDRGTDSTSDQTALNHAIWTEELPVHPLPALCNWCCHLAEPRLNEKTLRLCEPLLPLRELGIVHMTADFKPRTQAAPRAYNKKRHPVPTIDLRFRALRGGPLHPETASPDSARLE